MMAKYTNTEQTMCESNGWYGKPSDLIRLGHLKEGEEIAPYVAPIPTIQDQIDELERQQTPRVLRNAALGDQFAINKLNEIESAITDLRKQL